MTDMNGRSGWDRFFFYLHRINAVLLISILLFALISLAYQAYRWSSYNTHDDFIESGFDKDLDRISGDVIDTSDGQRIVYEIAALDKGGRDITGANLSFTAMESGKSRLVLPDDSNQIVLNWSQLKSKIEGVQAYSVLAGSLEDYDEGTLDWIVGRFSDLEQRTMAKRVRFIDEPQMIDDDTMSVIVWPTKETAEFWLIDLSRFEVVGKRPVALPALGTRQDGNREALDDASTGAPVNAF